MKVILLGGELVAMVRAGRVAICIAAALFAPSALAKSKSQASLELSNAQYVRASEIYFREGASRAQTSLKLGWTGDYEKRSWVASAKLRDDIRSEEDHHYIKPFDLNAGKDGDQFWFRVGRKTYDWSVADSFWGMGLWQPRFLDDKLNRESAGFTGGFFGVKSDRFAASLMVSPWFLPDMGPNSEIQNDKFVSQNPWFRPPTGSVILSGNEAEIRYTLHRPAEQDVIEHAMVAEQVEYRPRPTRFVRLSSAFKPMNQLLLGGPINLHLVSPNYVSVEVEPRVVYHQVTTLEAGVAEETPWKVWGSLSYEKVYRDDPPAQWISQQAADAKIGSVFVGYRAPEGGPEVYASYLRILGGESQDQSPFSLGSPIFEQRYMFLDAVKVGANTTGHWFSHRWLTRIDSSVTYDFAQHGVLASLQLAQVLSKYWTLSLSADGLGLVDQSGRVKNGFLSYYRANDRVALGINYVF